MSRFDLNIATGILHTAKETEATTIVIGLHNKANIVDSFFGNLTEDLLKNTYQQVMIARFLMPVNTLRRIIVAVPPKSEFEHGLPHEQSAGMPPAFLCPSPDFGVYQGIYPEEAQGCDDGIPGTG